MEDRDRKEARIQQVIAEIKALRKILVKTLRAYYMGYRDAQLDLAETCRNKYTKRVRIQIISNDYLRKIHHLTEVFGEFKILSPGCVAFGSAERGNYKICQLGDYDYFRNALWIHVALVKEIITDLRFRTNCDFSDFDRYEKLLNEYKRLSNELYYSWREIYKSEFALLFFMW